MERNVLRRICYASEFLQYISSVLYLSHVDLFFDNFFGKTSYNIKYQISNASSGRISIFYAMHHPSFQYTDNNIVATLKSHTCVYCVSQNFEIGRYKKPYTPLSWVQRVQMWTPKKTLWLDVLWKIFGRFTFVVAEVKGGRWVKNESMW